MKLISVFSAAFYLGAFASNSAVAGPESIWAFTTLAGKASVGSRDGADTARFNSPHGVALDRSGNIFVADTSNHTIRKITPSGVVTTVAGSPGVVGATDGNGSNARFNRPTYLAAADDGSLYVSDNSNHTIRKISPEGVVSTFAGTAGRGAGVDGVGSEARFFYPEGLALDRSGNLYVADSLNHAVRKITPTGTVTTLAGLLGTSGIANGTGSAARFIAPRAIALDEQGNVYVGDIGNYRIPRITPEGVVTTFASGFYASGLAIDSTGSLYISQTNETYYTDDAVAVVHVIRPGNLFATVIAGHPTASGSTDGAGATARFRSLGALALDGQGNLFVADAGNNAIRKIASDRVVSTVAGIAPGSLDGIGEAARFNFPSGVAADREGNLYVVETGDYVVRKISPAGTVTTLAGAAGIPGFVNALGGNARFLYLRGDVAVDPAGNVVVVDAGNVSGNTLRKITPDGVVSSYSGVYANPRIAFDRSGQLYVSDAALKTITKVSSTGLRTPFVGKSAVAGTTDGQGEDARFTAPTFMAFDRDDNLFVYDADNQRIRKISPAGFVITVQSNIGPINGLAVDADGGLLVSRLRSIQRIAPDGAMTALGGLPEARAGDDDGIGSNARFSFTQGISLDVQGNLYVADAGNNTIRKGVPVPESLPLIVAQPRPQTIALGSTFALSVDASGTPAPSFQWMKDGFVLNGATRATFVIDAASTADAGSYSCAITNSVGTTISQPARVAVSSTLTPSRITNFSVRALAGSESQTLNVGLTLASGAASSPLPLLLRAAGPSLAPFQISNFLLDPKLELSGNGGTVGANDDWDGTASLADVAARLGAFSLISPTSKDAALFLPSLAVGGYKLIVTGAGHTTGVVLAEIYDATPNRAGNPSSSRLINVSARGQIAVGDPALVAGFVIEGETSKTLLIRGVGPSLAPFGVSGTLADPRLRLYSGSTLLRENDNWSTETATPAAWPARVGAFTLPADSKDAALVVTLSPGAYTAHVSGIGGVMGVALIEIFELP